MNEHYKLVNKPRNQASVYRDDDLMLRISNDKVEETGPHLLWKIEEYEDRYLYLRRDPFDQHHPLASNLIDYRKDFIVFGYRDNKLVCDHYDDDNVDCYRNDHDIPGEYGAFTITPVGDNVLIKGDGVTIMMSPYQIIVTRESDLTMVWSNDGVTLIDYRYDVTTTY